MSQEQIDALKRGFEAFNRGDWDEALDGFAEDVVQTAYFAPIAGERSLHGRGAIKRAWEAASEVFGGGGTYRVEPQDFRDLGGGVILVRVRFSGRGTASGVETGAEVAQLWTIRHGRVVRIDQYADVAEALEAAGLSEKAMSQASVEIDRQNRDLEVLREVYSHWERGDFTSWEAFADDYVWQAVDAIESGEYTGIAEVSAAWRTWLQAWDGFSVEAEEVVAGSDGRYVVMQLFRGKGKASGLESEERSAAVVTMRDGLIARMEGFWDRDAALQAAGVERR